MMVAKAAARATKTAFVICQFGEKRHRTNRFYFVHSFIHSPMRCEHQTNTQNFNSIIVYLYLCSLHKPNGWLFPSSLRSTHQAHRQIRIETLEVGINLARMLFPIHNMCLGDIFPFRWEYVRVCCVCINHVLIPQMLLKWRNEFNSKYGLWDNSLANNEQQGAKCAHTESELWAEWGNTIQHQ